MKKIFAESKTLVTFAISTANLLHLTTLVIPQFLYRTEKQAGNVVAS